MTTLPPHIKDLFFKTLSGDISIEDFEQWLYQSKELEQLLIADDHFELISYNFKQAGAKYGLASLLKKHIDIGAYEKWKLKKLLDKVEQKQGDYPRAITEFYDLYFRGYAFLDKLALNYGLTLDYPWSPYGLDSFDQMTEQQQKDLADSFYPDINIEIHRVRDWLDTDQIKLKGAQNEFGEYEFIDNRPKEDKPPTTYTVQDRRTSKKWWQVWK